jgi:hypothetical protein
MMRFSASRNGTLANMKLQFDCRTVGVKLHGHQATAGDIR